MPEDRGDGGECLREYRRTSFRRERVRLPRAARRLPMRRLPGNGRDFSHTFVTAIAPLFRYVQQKQKPGAAPRHKETTANARGTTG